MAKAGRAFKAHVEVLSNKKCPNCRSQLFSRVYRAGLLTDGLPRNKKEMIIEITMGRMNMTKATLFFCPYCTQQPHEYLVFHDGMTYEWRLRKASSVRNSWNRRKALETMTMMY